MQDGYAVHAADGPGDYSVAFEAFAGRAPQVLEAGSVAYIGTGGPVPEGADAVVQIEDTEFLGIGEGGLRRVRIKAPVKSGQDIRQVWGVGCVLQEGVGAALTAFQPSSHYASMRAYMHSNITAHVCTCKHKEVVH